MRRHCESSTHTTVEKAKAERQKIQEEGAGELSKYSDNGLARDLCEAFVSANIPWAKIENTKVKEMLQKWTGQKMPCAVTLAERLDDIYAEVMDKIKDDLRGKPFWLGTDETQDACERSVANIMIGTLLL